MRECFLQGKKACQFQQIDISLEIKNFLQPFFLSHVKELSNGGGYRVSVRMYSQPIYHLFNYLALYLPYSCMPAWVHIK